MNLPKMFLTPEIYSLSQLETVKETMEQKIKDLEKHDIGNSIVTYKLILSKVENAIIDKILLEN